jgi:glucuronokinase
VSPLCWLCVRSRYRFLIVGCYRFKYYERWATANDFPTENIINDGTTTFASRLGALSDFDLVLRSKNITDDVMVVAGDMLFQAGFDVHAVSRFFKQKDGDLAIYYSMDPREKTSSRGIVEVDPSTHQITSFKEKPADGSVSSRLASVVFYCFRASSFEAIRKYTQDPNNEHKSSWGHFMETHVEQTEVRTERGAFHLFSYSFGILPPQLANLTTNLHTVPPINLISHQYRTQYCTQ